MFSFNNNQLELPLSSVWLMNALAEYKGRQDLFRHQSPQILHALLELALVESAESSNRIEGVTVDHDRLKPLILGKSAPRDRSEEEVAGYRAALQWIHEKHQQLEITPATLLELHRLCRGEYWDSGKWKEKNNDIIKKHPDGRIEVVFKPVDAQHVPDMINQLCLSYNHAINQEKFPHLYAVACLILDFLSIHPFRDGNGRVSRLLTLLALYHHRYLVGQYISLERIIEQSKETYYESLNRSSQRWHEAKHDPLPWLNYFMGTIILAYKEFEERATHMASTRGSKTDMIISMINKQVNEFAIRDIETALPTVSRDMIRVVIRKLQLENKVQSLGKGRAARWKRIG